MTIKKELIQELVQECNSPEEILGKDGLLKQITKAVVEAALEGEMTDHLGYPPNSQTGNNTGNSRNGKGRKVLKGDLGEIPVDIPRDRNGTYDGNFGVIRTPIPV